MKSVLVTACVVLATAAFADERAVYLETNEGMRIQIAKIALDTDGSYSIAMAAEPFADHFLSMRPFRCIEGPSKHWCHVPYPYDILRNIGADLIDLEYDFLFIWKGATEYGINMWNGVYYKLDDVDEQLVGTLHEMDMGVLSAPPESGNLRPVRAEDLHESDPDSHWLPRLVIE
ncbi:MAG: hypothetical protein AAFQ58_19960 [Pseudomonadota bacterium]